jgi:hypothetical protein
MQCIVQSSSLLVAASSPARSLSPSPWSPRGGAPPSERSSIVPSGRGIAGSPARSCTSTVSFGEIPSPIVSPRSIPVGRIAIRLPDPVDLVPPWPGDTSEFPAIGERGLLGSSNLQLCSSGPAGHVRWVRPWVDAPDAEVDGEVEEFFGQLWAIPSSPPARHRQRPGSILCWIRRGIRDSDLTIFDCFPAEKSALIHHRPRVIRRGVSFSSSFVEVLYRAMPPQRGRGRGRSGGGIPSGGVPLQGAQPPVQPPLPPAPHAAATAPPPRLQNNQGRQFQRTNF